MEGDFFEESPHSSSDGRFENIQKINSGNNRLKDKSIAQRRHGNTV
jgi:hypothetical protein